MPIFRRRKVIRRRRPVARKPRVFRRGRRIARMFNPMSRNTARVVEQIDVPADLSGNQPYSFIQTLASYPRALAVAANYQFYRLAYIKYTYTPLNPLGTGDTGVAGAIARKSNFYFMMNRQGETDQTLTLDWILSQGAKNIPFGDSRARNVVVKYKPNLLIDVVTSGTGATSTAVEPTYNKWVNSYDGGTVNSNVNYWGHYVWIDDPLAADELVSDTRIEAVWEFKNPYSAQPVTGMKAIVL